MQLPPRDEVAKFLPGAITSPLTTGNNRADRNAADVLFLIAL
jgi:hypothetical protein